ncbi:DUF6603 domain-containing protein [Larkinella bovis]|uniref:DUF6603 domain-containing protein n=1 Tax=Larkinella bovis TaxID=683041 RepID=A0ABW0II61_9BACT
MADALKSVLTQAGLAMAPLRAVRTPAQAQELFRKLGYEIPVGAFGSALSEIGTKGTELLTAIQQLATASGDSAILAAIGETFGRVVAMIDAIKQLHTTVKNSGGGALPNINDLPRRLTDYLILDYFSRLKPEVHEMLLLLGLIEYEASPGPNQSMRLINWDRLGWLFTNPVQLFNATYQWDTNFNADKFLSRLEGLMRASALPGGLYPQSETTRVLLGNTSTTLRELRFPIFQKGLTPETYSQFGITFSPADANGGKKKGVALLPYIMGAASFDFAVCDRGELIFESTADIKGVGLVVRPPFNAEGLLSMTAAYRASVLIHEKPDKSVETVLIGSAGGTRLAVQGLGARWFVQNAQNRLDVGMEGQIDAIRLVIKGGDGDGFLQTVLSGINIMAESNVAFSFSLLNGFTISGGAKFGIDLPVHLELGPVSVNGLAIAIAPETNQFKLEAGANLKLALGPLVAVVENIGLQAGLQFQQGNLGPMNLGVDFKPPVGIGLSLDAGIIKGGGYVLFDDAKKMYAGALELSIQDTIQVAAICVINTRMPDGKDGFSLLILISATFTPGISLSMGFFLSGLGGILGIHRSINVDALRDGVRNNSIDHIMFPEDVVNNITSIIQSITQIFPPKQDQFIIGLMARITWGIPALITVDFGLVIEFANPTRIAILGVVKIVLPTEEAAILRLQVNFVGIIDFEKGMLSFDASLYNSRILTFTLEGDMALRLGWGQTKAFVLSIGGFHPAFKPPTELHLPSMKRLTLTILADNPKLVLTCYFAVTSNTIQFGARLDLLFSLSAFKIVGYLYFDVLFQFSPFMFIAAIGAGLAVKMGSTTLFSITLDFQLSGPTPWRAKGTASFSILFFTIKVRFDVEWGDKSSIELPTIAVLPKALEALSLDTNWTAELPPNRPSLVSIKDIPQEPGKVILQPFGSFTVSQTVVPIAQVLEKFGENKPADIQKVDITKVKIGDLNVAQEYPTEAFAPAMFKNLEDKDKLSSPSYEQMKSGVRITETNKIQVNFRANRKVEYEVKVSDFDPTPEPAPRSFFNKDIFKLMAKGGAIGSSALSRENAFKKVKQADVDVLDEAFMVVDKLSMKPVVHDSFSAGSFSDASDTLSALLNKNPELKGKIKVVPAYHLEMA